MEEVVLTKYDSDFGGYITSRKRWGFFVSVFVIGRLYSDHRVHNLGKTASSLALLHLLKFGDPVYLLIVTSTVQKQYYYHTINIGISC